MRDGCKLKLGPGMLHPLGSVPLSDSWREQGQLSLTGGENAASAPSLGEAPGKKDTAWLGRDSAKPLRLLLEQGKVEECR